MSAKRSFAAHLDVDVLAALRATVIGLQQIDPSYTIARFVTEALVDAIGRAEATYNAGEPWPTTNVSPRRGPRLLAEQEAGK